MITGTLSLSETYLPTRFLVFSSRWSEPGSDCAKELNSLEIRLEIRTREPNLALLLLHPLANDSNVLKADRSHTTNSTTKSGRNKVRLL